MGNPVIEYLGQDLYALGYVNNIPDIEQTKGFGRGKIAPSDFSFNVRNTDNQFSVDNPTSFLNGIDWQFQPIKQYDEDGILRFDGIVANISRDHNSKTADVECKDIIFQSRKSGIADYISSAWETPASAAKNIMDAEGFTNYDSASIQASINTLTSNACYVKVKVLNEDKVTLIDILQKLAQYGAADIYMKDNNIFYEHWKPYSGGTSISFNYTDSELTPLTAPVIETLEQSFYNDYSIGYDGDAEVPATDSANTNIAYGSRLRFGAQKFELSRSSNSQILFKDKASAVYIGETMIKMGHYSLTPVAKILQTIKFDLAYRFKGNVELGTYFKMTFAEEGWVNKIFQVSSIKRSLDSQKISIDALEVTSG